MRIFLYLIPIFFSTSAFCQTNFDKGKTLFEQKRYTQAAEFYHAQIGEFVVDFKTKNLFAQPNKTQLELCTQKMNLLHALEQKGAALVAKGEINPALHNFLTADHLIDIMRKNHTTNDAELSWKETTQSLYEKALDLTFVQKDNERAFYFFEKYKSILLLDATKPIFSLPDSLKLREKKLSQATSLAANEASKDKRKYPIYLKKNKELLDFLSYLSEEHPAYYAIYYETEVPDLQQNNETYSYQNDTEYVHFFCGKKYIYALRFGAGNSNFARTIRTIQTDALLEKFISQAPQQKDNDLAFQIYEWLLNPLFPDKIFPENLLFLTDSLLENLKFEELKTTLNSSEKLRQKTNIEYAYSIKNLAEKTLNNLTDKSLETKNTNWKYLLFGGMAFLIWFFVKERLISVLLFLRKKI